MDFKVTQSTINMYRYAGVDGKKTVTAKVGSIDIGTRPAVSTAPGDGGIPVALWEDLTIKEQRELVEHLAKENATARRARVTELAKSMQARAKDITVDLDADVAAILFSGLDEISSALKRAKHKRPPRADRQPPEVA
jgi:hypothetical protein